LFYRYEDGHTNGRKVKGIRVIRKSGIPPVKELRSICQQPLGIARESWLSNHFARAISIHITRILLHTPVTANQVTVGMILLGVAAGTLFTFGNYWLSIIGIILLLAAYILDRVDGEIARYRKATSIQGNFLDDLYHDIVKPYIFIGISFGIYANFHTITAFILGFSASVSVLLILFIDLQRTSLLSEAGKPADNSPTVVTLAEGVLVKSGRAANPFKRLLKTPIPSDTETIFVLVIVGVIADYLHIILWIFGIMLPCRVLIQIVSYMRRGFPD
jgi:phosphatidylglycerophosphate synthase